MVVFNYSGKEINAKIVYYGPGLSGKTTNLEKIYGFVPENRRGKMVSMKTRSDRTLFFDFLPVNAGEIRGFRTRFLLYTVPGQVHYNATRKLVLKGTDAIIFVADSDPALRQANKESMANLEQNLAEYQLALEKIPVILQYNKRDLPNALTVEELNKDLNAHGWPYFEAVAVQNDGVWETFRAATTALFETLQRTLGEEEAPAASSSENDAGDEAPPDPRFASSQKVYDLDANGEDVVRISDSFSRWGGEEEAGREAAVSPPSQEDVSRETVDDMFPPDDTLPEPEPAEPEPAGEEEWAVEPPPAEPAPEPQRPARSEFPGRVTVSADVGARNADGEEDVVRVPVRIEHGEGKVRIEIALEINLKEEKEPAEEAGVVDSKRTWT